MQRILIEVKSIHCGTQNEDEIDCGFFFVKIR